MVMFNNIKRNLALLCITHKDITLRGEFIAWILTNKLF